MQPNQKRIQRMSRIFRTLFTVGLYTVPFFPAIYWLGLNYLPAELQSPFSSCLMQSHCSVEYALPLNLRFLAFGGTIPSTLVLIFSLLSVRRLFSLYGQNIYFERQNIDLYKRLGKLAIWAVFCDVFSDTVRTLATSLNNPPGERMLRICFSTEHFKLLIVSGIILVIAMVMDEAKKMSEEQQLTV